MAPPLKTLTEEQRAQLEALAAYLTQDQIADHLGITRPTLAAMIKRDEDIALRFARGRATMIGDVAKGVIDRAKKGDQRAAEFYLERVGGWASRSKAEVTGADGGPMQVETSDARDRLKALIARRTAADEPGS
jgi:predicted transcriptional regulator